MTAIRLGSEGLACHRGRAAAASSRAEERGATTSNIPLESIVLDSDIGPSMMLRRVAENCERLGLHRSRRPGRPPSGWATKARQKLRPRKLLRSFAPLGGRRRVRSHVSSLVEFTTDSIEQEDARGLVKIDQMRKTLSTGDYLCPFDRLSGS